MPGTAWRSNRTGARSTRTSRTSGTSWSRIPRDHAICLRFTGSATASRSWTSERRTVGLLAPAAAVVAGERTVPAATWLGRAGLGAGRLHAAHGDVLRRGRGLLGGRGDGPLLDARHGARIARHGGKCRARRGAARGVVRLLAGGEIASSARRSARRRDRGGGPRRRRRPLDPSARARIP